MVTATRISWMTPEDAIDAIDRLHAASITQTNFDRDDFIRNMKDAFTHPSSDVVIAAIYTCIETNYTYEFEQELADMAGDFGRGDVAVKAIETAEYCSDLSLFHHCFKRGMAEHSDSGIAMAILGVLDKLSEFQHELEPPYDGFLETGLKHADYDVFWKALNIADSLEDSALFNRALDIYTMNLAHPDRTCRILELLEYKKEIHLYAAQLDRAVRSSVAEVAQAAMEVIRVEIDFVEVIDDKLLPIVLWAFGSSRDDIAEGASRALACTTDKSKFEQVLNRDAAAFYQQDKVLRAVQAMERASRIEPFTDALLNIINQADGYFAFKVYEMLDCYSMSELRDRAAALNGIVRAGLAHNSVTVTECFLNLTEKMAATSEFLEEIQDISRKWPWTGAAEKADGLIENYTRKLSIQKASSLEPLIAARIDFTASATEEEKGRLHSRDLADLLIRRFRKATIGDMSIGEAVVFYLPNQASKARLSEGQKVSVVIMPNQMDVLEGHLVGGRSPECLLDRCRDGSYRVTIEPLPPF